MRFRRIDGDQNPAQTLQNYYNYLNLLDTRYDEREKLREKYELEERTPNEKPDSHTPHPTNIHWWLSHWDRITGADNPDYDTLTTSLSMQDLYENLPISDTDNNRRIVKLSVLRGVACGVLESNDITVDNYPVENIPTLSSDGSESIRLADPREHPYLYIERHRAYQYLTRERWVEIFQTDYRSPTDGLPNPKQFVGQLPAGYSYRREYIYDYNPQNRITKEAIAQAMIGLGNAVGVINIGQRVSATNNFVLMLNEYWDKYTSANKTLSKSDIFAIMSDPTRPPRDLYFDLFRYTNILYQDGSVDGYRLNRPTDNQGPSYRDVSPSQFYDLYTYHEIESPPDNFDIDAYAVDQFVRRHVTVGSDDDDDVNSMWVSVDEFMDAFDQWATMNDATLDSLQIGRANNMRKGAMRSILENHWDMEKASVRTNDGIVRAFRPIELDDSVSQIV